MNPEIALWLAQDAVTNGALYALLALAIIVVYTVTRVILVPQGEFVSYAALSLATLQAGKVPGTVYLLLVAGVAVVVLDVWPLVRRRALGALTISLCWNVLAPLLVAAAAWAAAARPDDLLLQLGVTLALVTLMGPIVYRCPLPALWG